MSLPSPVTRDEYRNFRARLEHFYRDLSNLHNIRVGLTTTYGFPYTTHVDPLGEDAWEQLYFHRRANGESHEDATQATQDEIDLIEGRLPLVPPLVPVTLGNWQGNFLYPFDSERFFGPACAAWGAARRAAYFAHLRGRGDQHAVINADQDDWGPIVGHPEYTGGGFRAYASPRAMKYFLDVLIEARTAGLMPVVGIVDQQTLLGWTLARVIQWTKELVAAAWEHTPLFMLSWEINEVWSTGDVREPNLERWIGEVDWHGRDVGIHFSGGVLSGGMNFYGRVPKNVTRLYQWEYGISDAQLYEEAHLIADVAAKTGTKVCAFEHSSANQAPYYAESECIRRAKLVMEAFGRHGLKPEQVGSLNG